MLLYDVAADAEFHDLIDARFPYEDFTLASAMITRGWKTSLNAAFCVLDELCRPPRNSGASKELLRNLIDEWNAGPEHSLKEPLRGCAIRLLSGEYLPWRDGVSLMRLIAQYEGQLAALAIVYFASDCSTPEGDAALNAANDAIRREWRM